LIGLVYFNGNLCVKWLEEMSGEGGLHQYFELAYIGSRVIRDL